MQSMKRFAGQGGTKTRFLHTETVVDGTGVPVLMENTGTAALMAVAPGTSARVEFSLSDPASVAAGTASWHNWPSGDVTTVTTDSVTSNVTALRLVSVGSSSWEVVV